MCACPAPATNHELYYVRELEPFYFDWYHKCVNIYFAGPIGPFVTFTTTQIVFFIIAIALLISLIVGIIFRKSQRIDSSNSRNFVSRGVAARVIIYPILLLFLVIALYAAVQTYKGT